LKLLEALDDDSLWQAESRRRKMLATPPSQPGARYM
jgi:hypothetical protein